MNVKKYSVSGMTCDGCVKSIKTKLELVDDIVSAEVSLNDEYLLLSSEKNYEESEINELLKPVGSYKVSEDYNKPNIIKIISKYLSTYKPILITLIFVFLLSLDNIYSSVSLVFSNSLTSIFTPSFLSLAASFLTV